MTNREAIEIIDNLLSVGWHYDGEPKTDMDRALLMAVKALETLDDVNQKVYRNENCNRAGKCYDYIGWHCAGCGEVQKNEIR